MKAATAMANIRICCVTGRVPCIGRWRARCARFALVRLGSLRFGLLRLGPPWLAGTMMPRRPIARCEPSLHARAGGTLPPHRRSMAGAFILEICARDLFKAAKDLCLSANAAGLALRALAHPANSSPSPLSRGSSSGFPLEPAPAKAGAGMSGVFAEVVPKNSCRRS
jgi:hypothetical protein